MALPLTRKRFTPAEYYALEHDAVYKSDYYDGEIFDMSGGTSDHSLITTNLLGVVWQGLRGKPCKAYESNMRLKTPATGLRTYPDVSVYCAPLEYDPEDPRKTTAMNPTVVIEVSSPSTESYDRGVKAESYRQLDSLKTYVLVAQNRAYVEIRDRLPNSPWAIREVSGLDAIAKLDAIGVELPLSEVYDGVEFPAQK
ncbi:MAG: Uma2 family endonuclease [Tepidisphaeraceae bacterium]